MCRVNYARACRSPDFCTTQDSCPGSEPGHEEGLLPLRRTPSRGRYDQAGR